MPDDGLKEKKEPTIEWVRHEVDRIASIADDDESAHSAEDRLHKDVLGAIANGSIKPHDAAAFAGLALETTRIDFARWCA